MSQSQLMSSLLVSFLMLATSAVEAKTKAIEAQDISTFLPTGFYRKLSGDELKCPPGHFQWLENNKMLTIGAGQPVILHSFNKSEMSVISQQPKCQTETTTHVNDSSVKKVPRRTVVQVVKNDCANAVTTTETTLEASKIKGKTAVDLTIQVKRLSPEKRGEPSVHCKYEIGPL